VVRERLQAGDDDKEIIRYVVARYGDFVLLSPPVNSRTLLLWASPGVLLALGLGWLVMSARRRRTLVQTPPLSEAERRDLRRLLDQ
jgi:cytochrome c-type biogenesis protein CcmH